MIKFQQARVKLVQPGVYTARSPELDEHFVTVGFVGAVVVVVQLAPPTHVAEYPIVQLRFLQSVTAMLQFYVKLKAG